MTKLDLLKNKVVFLVAFTILSGCSTLISVPFIKDKWKETEHMKKIKAEKLKNKNVQGIILSGGPSSVYDKSSPTLNLDLLDLGVPILGVCLGHQCIVEHFGGDIVYAKRLMHGKTSTITHDGLTIFAGLDNSFEAGRYHSLAADRDTIPEVLTVSAQTKDDEVMGVRHRTLPVEGVQFHPESVLTPDGEHLMSNFLKI